jgi:hypothetical protein
MYQETSHAAYHSLDRVNDKQQRVFDAIRRLGTCNDRMISESLGWPINRVTPRRGELVSAGLIVEADRRRDVTGRLSIFWRVKEQQLTLF